MPFNCIWYLFIRQINGYTYCLVDIEFLLKFVLKFVNFLIFHNRLLISNCFIFNKNNISISIPLDTTITNVLSWIIRDLSTCFCICTIVEVENEKKKKKKKKKTKEQVSLVWGKRERQCSRIPLVKRSLNVIESRKEEKNVVTFLYSHA